MCGFNFDWNQVWLLKSGLIAEIEIEKKIYDSPVKEAFKE